MDRKTFFSGVRASLFGGKLTADHVTGITAILDAMEGMDKRWIAYALATAYHETGRAMMPVLENLNYSATGLRTTFPRYFSAADAVAYARKPEAIANRAYANRLGNGNEASGDGWKFKGRGVVQITGRANYAKFRIVAKPDDALNIDVSVSIMVGGMINGKFTGKKLADYFDATKTDWVNARRIINILDKASTIAEYAKQFHAALIVADNVTAH
jgi:putative chitinase